MCTSSAALKYYHPNGAFLVTLGQQSIEPQVGNSHEPGLKASCGVMTAFILQNKYLLTVMVEVELFFFLQKLLPAGSKMTHSGQPSKLIYAAFGEYLLC